MFLPTPGAVVSAIGGAMQGAEQFVTGAVNTAIDTLQNVASESTRPEARATIMDPRTGARTDIQGAVSAEDFRKFADAVAKTFNAVREDIASIRAYGADGEGGLLGGYGNGGGGGGSGIDPLMLVLLLNGSGSGTLDTNTLALLMLSGGGGGDDDTLMMLAVLGLI